MCELKRGKGREKECGSEVAAHIRLDFFFMFSIAHSTFSDVIQVMLLHFGFSSLPTQKHGQVVAAILHGTLLISNIFRI